MARCDNAPFLFRCAWQATQRSTRRQGQPFQGKSSPVLLRELWENECIWKCKFE